MISTTTCLYDTPRRYDGTTPTGNNQVFGFASTSCTTVKITDATTSPLRYDSVVTGGDVLISFWLMLIAAFLFIRFAIMDA